MKKEKEIWASIINDAREYNGTPQELNQLTEHFMNQYEVTKKIVTGKDILKKRLKRKTLKKDKNPFDFIKGWSEVIKNM